MENIIIMEEMAMIDIHCHLIFGVDDGSKSIEESISVLKGLADYGYTDIILTPHYISDSIYCSTKKQNMVILKKIEEALQQKKIKLNLYLGNEVFIDYHILSLLKEGKISTLNNSQYLLIELPMSGEFEGYEEVFMELIANGYQVILAHPERYLTFQKDFNKVYELVKLGILFQFNLNSIIGNYFQQKYMSISNICQFNVTKRPLLVLATVCVNHFTSF